ncbi:MAG: type VII secretion protein EssC [Ruminococcaceae bacterium]|nr:type VII secretion protein EssC [Oscillospiraceae bacterium]
MPNESGIVIGGNQSAQDGVAQGTGIHAILIEKNGGMGELWLPETFEGKYTFPIAGDHISIVAENSQWKACVANGGYFAANSSYFSPMESNSTNGGVRTKKNEMFLQSNSLSLIHVEDKVFSLYLEDDSDSSRVFQPYYVERDMDIFIGREPACDIQYMNHLVSREHAVLKYVGNKLTITDKNSKNGVYVNGRQIQSTELVLGDVIHILGLCIIVGPGYIAMNNADKCRIMSQRVVPLSRKNNLTYLPPTGTADSLYDRKPRKKYKLDEKVIEIESPPHPLPKTKVPLALRMGSQAVMGGQAIFTGNYLGALTSLVFPAMTQGLTEKDRKDYEEKRVERYREYLKFIENEIATEIDFEERFFRDIFPDFNATLGFVEKRSRLWERRKKDDDFLTVRLGTGIIPMVAEKKYNKQKFQMEPDFLEQEMYALAEKPSVLRNVPITVSLKDNWVFGILGSRSQSLQMVIKLIAYIAITHAYDDVKMVVLAPETMEKELAFTKYLRHFWDNERTVRFVAANSSDVQTITKYFRDIETKEKEKKKTSQSNDAGKKPAYIVFALDKNLFEQSELFKELLQEDQYCGFSFVPAFENVPKECTKLVDLRREKQLIDLNDPSATNITIYEDVVDSKSLRRSMSSLSKIGLLMDSDVSYTLPSMVTFLEMYGVGRVEHLNPLSRWELNNPVKSLAVPIGVGTDGKLFTLDLHEKYQGPHGLVAGMTGSGKSEFIITYILSLAVNFSPDEVAFVLIDYKGGGLADAFVDPKRGIHLPHVVATITNLDGAAIQRSLTSIHSELSRRQEMFKRAKSETGEGTMDIYDYQRLYRNKRVSEPMPHLFIISDEFAELKKQEPEFMDALISAARIGRSLGVHLILATQKPGGVVNDQIWSNTKFRACLRVQDRSDSMEMLKRPEAAELKQTGRFYLQVGYNEFFALGQSAWCGAGYVPQEEIVKEKDNSVEFVDNAGQVILHAKEKKVKAKAESKQIVAIVKYLSDLAKRENIVPKSLWCEPLPALLEYNDVVQEGDAAPEGGLPALIGRVDDPVHQKQFPLYLDLRSFHHMALCGLAGSGKSTFFKTMLYSLVMNYTPEEVNFYILDLSGGVLSVFHNTPHCGAYLTKENEADFDRLLALVQEIVDERKKLFAKAEVFSYDDYIKIDKLPVVLVVLDGWTNIGDFVKGQEYSLYISKNMRDATNYGIRFMFSVNHMNEFSAKVNLELDYRITLQAKDKFDYNDILTLRNATVPPEITGRGLCNIDGIALEYQVAVPHSELDVQQQGQVLREELKARAAQLQGCKAAKCLPVMDDKLEYAPFCNSFAPDRIPLGFSMQSMQPVAIPLQQLHTMGLYFGNPLGVKPVIFNLLSAFRRENAEVIVVRRNAGTIFDRDTEGELRDLFGDRYSVFGSNSEEVSRLFDFLLTEYIPKYRVPYRNEYCEQHGIPATDGGRTIKAARYIRSKTAPLFVLFESFADLAEADKEMAFAEVFSKLKGFNIYFAGCFYPEDESKANNAVFRSFSKSDFSLLFGGQFHTQWLTNLTVEYKRMETVNPNYNRFVMRYRNAFHKMIMPCGELLSADADPDEKEII